MIDVEHLAGTVLNGLLTELPSALLVATGAAVAGWAARRRRRRSIRRQSGRR
jgi:hypothetical protein